MDHTVRRHGRRPVLIPVTGDYWDDQFEVCRDKKQKYSGNGRAWTNTTAWNPHWSAVCWYTASIIP